MKTILHPADSRGSADLGWLKPRYSFSFANYYNPERIHFGALRVLNDDTIAPGTGFGTHPHDNMEIITIPTEGELEHRDSMGHSSIIRSGDVQVMSAGTGIHHSEYNASRETPLKLFQIWILPKTRNIQPRYDQKSYARADRRNRWRTVVAPEGIPESLWINQDAWISLSTLDKGTTLDYTPYGSGTGLYVMIVSGEASVAGENLGKRDAIGIWEMDSVRFTARVETEFLLIEIPLH